MNISSKEFKAILELEPFGRYKYLIKRFADLQTIFSLENAQKEIALAKVENKMLISFWPAKEFALTLATGLWAHYSEFEISLDLFNNRFIPEIRRGGFLLNIFPVFDKVGFVVDIDEFMVDLNKELDNY